MLQHSVAPLLLLLAASCAADTPEAAPPERPAVAPDPPPAAFAIDGAADDAATAEVAEIIEAGVPRVEAYFELPFREPFTVELLPDRAAFDRSLPPEWGLTSSACWMVATGVADALRALSPSAWERDACEHDARDAEHVRGIFLHELVHVFHGQYNPTGDFTGAEELGWFAEGLAVLVSGQLETGHRASALEAVETGAMPTELARAWSGPHRYGVAGTLVEFIEVRQGRDVLVELLPCTTQAELLEVLDLTEADLLGGWEAFVLDQAGG